MKKYLLFLGVILSSCLDSDIEEPYYGLISEHIFNIYENVEYQGAKLPVENWTHGFAGYDESDANLVVTSAFTPKVPDGEKPVTELNMEVVNNSNDNLIGYAIVKVSGLESGRSYESWLKYVELETKINDELDEEAEEELNEFLAEKGTDNKLLNGVFLKYGIFENKPTVLNDGDILKLSIEAGERNKSTDDLFLLGRLPKEDSDIYPFNPQNVEFTANEDGEAWVTLVWMSNMTVDHSVNFDFIRILYHKR